MIKRRPASRHQWIRLRCRPNQRSTAEVFQQPVAPSYQDQMRSLIRPWRLPAGNRSYELTIVRVWVSRNHFGTRDWKHQRNVRGYRDFSGGLALVGGLGGGSRPPGYYRASLIIVPVSTRGRSGRPRLTATSAAPGSTRIRMGMVSTIWTWCQVSSD